MRPVLHQKKPQQSWEKQRNRRDYTGRNTRLSDRLIGKIPEDIRRTVPDRYEVIGDIVVITLPDHLSSFRDAIAGAILSAHPRTRTILRKVTTRNGSHRIAEYLPIMGSATRTRYREAGFIYQVDLATAFFTSRMAGEHQRISAMVRPDETVLIPFAGVGPFVIPVASKGARVIAIEINPDACRLLRENIHLNRCSTRVEILRADARTTEKILNSLVDRVIIPAPYGLDGTLPNMCRVVKPRGYIHYYTFQNRDSATAIAGQLHDDGYEVLRYHRCGNVAPSVSRWVYDIRKRG